MRSAIATVLVALLVSLTGCATTTVGVTFPVAQSRNGDAHPFYKPGTADLYVYGNFCGPKVPRINSVTGVEARVSAVTQIRSRDDIDLACKAHDLCYERFGDDNFHCDLVLGELLRGNTFVGPKGDQMACKAVANDVDTAVLFLKANQKDGAQDRNTATRRASALVGRPLSVALFLSSNMWPREAGHCVFESEKRGAQIQAAFARLKEAARAHRTARCEPGAEQDCRLSAGAVEQLTPSQLFNP